MITLSFVLLFLSTSLSPHSIKIHNTNASIVIPSSFNQSWVLFSGPSRWMVGMFCLDEGQFKRKIECRYDVWGNTWWWGRGWEKLGEENIVSLELQLEESRVEPLNRLSILIERLPAQSWPCLVCTVSLLRTFDGQVICSNTHKVPKNVCQNKAVSKFWQHDRVSLNLSAFEIPHFSQTPPV